MKRVLQGGLSLLFYKDAIYAVKETNMARKRNSTEKNNMNIDYMLSCITNARRSLNIVSPGRVHNYLVQARELERAFAQEELHNLHMDHNGEELETYT